ncbi:type II secretion system protein GspK [Ramlibacter sp. H39-3-26]|uniref:general secretion pathway protein GspK n=1 Tax=Curvibacter soli TaxID=3031331 RepID=UPI0023DB9C97|nr:type II secretion system protein GspK [Ramlibacter sp. H39-3-26]MDF1486406.1 type II secretion system protein GspK [Ramlibacter sp. H39-3-26]
MALIAVLWIIAALSLITLSIGGVVRDEARLAQLARQGTQAGAQGDAAIMLVLQQMSAQPQVLRLDRQTNLNIQYMGNSIAVQITPLNGLVDINGAPEPLLVQMYATAAGADPQTAAALARATIEFRTQKNGQGAARNFDVVEDLLQVPGMSYALYARVAPWITADLRGTGRINPLAAPREVLLFLARGNAALADSIALSREAGQPGVDTTALDGSFLDHTASRLFRLQARVPVPGGGGQLVSRTITLDGSTRDGRPPWQTLHAERRIDPGMARPSN